MARRLSRRSSRLQNTSSEDMGRWEGKSFREARERFILSRRGEKRSFLLAFPLTLPLMLLALSRAEGDSPLAMTVTGDSARDCSAPSSVSISYDDDVPSGSVPNSLPVWDANERKVVWPVLADKNAVLIEEAGGVIAKFLLGDEGIVVNDDDAVAKSATVSDDRAGVMLLRMMILLLLAIIDIIHT